MGTGNSSIQHLEQADNNYSDAFNNDNNTSSSSSAIGSLPSLKLLMILVYSFISLAIFFNMRVIYIVLRALCGGSIRKGGCSTPMKHQSPGGNQHAYIYVLALSIVDSLVLAHLPLVATDIAVGHWVFGVVVCKLYWIIEQVNRILSTFILTALSADRYLAVCHPFDQRSRKFRTTKSALCVLTVSVLIAGTLLSPTYIYSNVVEAPGGLDGRCISKCAFNMDPPYICSPPITDGNDSTNTWNISQWNSSYAINPRSGMSPNAMFLICLFVCGYCIPLTCMLYFYTFIPLTLWRKHTSTLASPGANTAMPEGGGSRMQRGQKRAQNVTQRILILVLFYFGCWTPYWTVQVYLEFINDNSQNTHDLFFVAILIAHLLTYLNSAVNPFLYALLNRELQAHSSSSSSSMVSRAQQRQQESPAPPTRNESQLTAMSAKSNRAVRSSQKSSLFSRIWDLVGNRARDDDRRGSADPNEIPLLTTTKKGGNCHLRNARIQNSMNEERNDEH